MAPGLYAYNFKFFLQIRSSLTGQRVCRTSVTEVGTELKEPAVDGTHTRVVRASAAPQKLRSV